MPLTEGKTIWIFGFSDRTVDREKCFVVTSREDVANTGISEKIGNTSLCETD